MLKYCTKSSEHNYMLLEVENSTKTMFGTFGREVYSAFGYFMMYIMGNTYVISRIEARRGQGTYVLRLLETPFPLPCGYNS